MSAAEGASEASSPEQAQRVSGANERANGRASGPVLTSRFLVDPDHSGVEPGDMIEEAGVESMGLLPSGDVSCQDIAQFFAGRYIFLTGATGFVGKVG